MGQFSQHHTALALLAFGFVNVWLVRHGKAASRRGWVGSDSERPLIETGFAQAERLADRLSPMPIRRVLSSPFLRCRQSVEPLARRSGLVIELSDALAEGASIDATRALLRELVAASADAVACSHGDVIPEIIDDLARQGVELIGPRSCQKASVWQLEAPDGVIVRARYHPPE